MGIPAFADLQKKKMTKRQFLPLWEVRWGKRI